MGNIKKHPLPARLFFGLYIVSKNERSAMVLILTEIVSVSSYDVLVWKRLLIM